MAREADGELLQVAVRAVHDDALHAAVGVLLLIEEGGGCPHGPAPEDDLEVVGAVDVVENCEDVVLLLVAKQCQK